MNSTCRVKSRSSKPCAGPVDARLREHGGDVARGAHRVADRAQHVVAAQQAEEVQERPPQRRRLAQGVAEAAPGALRRSVAGRASVAVPACGHGPMSSRSAAARMWRGTVIRWRLRGRQARCPHRPWGAFALMAALTVARPQAGLHRAGRTQRVRLHHHRCRLRRLRARQPPLRRSRRAGAAARSRPARLASLHPHARRPGQAGRQQGRQLGLRHRAGAAARRPHAVVAARQGAGRLQLDQRDVLHPRRRRATTTSGPRWAPTAGTGTSVLPYFRRSERNQRGADALHGDEGPLYVSDLRYSNPLSQAFIEAGRAGGLPRSTATSTARAGGLRPLPGHAEERCALLQPRSPTSTRCASATTSPSSPARRSTASPSSAAAPTA